MQITWFGHSAFRVEIPDAKILIDPFFTGNPNFPGTVDAASAGVTHIVLTHGHGDHVGDTVAIAKKTGATVIANPEIVGWLAAQGVEKLDMGNTGGTVSLGAFTVTFTQALHSSSISGPDGGTVYMGNPLGVVIKAHGQPTLYHMGDTDLFSDMKLIDELHRPDIGIVPIGDRFTMSAKSAAYACSRFFNFKKVIPCHYGTFPLLAQSADEFVEDMSGSRAIVYVPERGVAFEALDPAL